jgi:hypothetical protein
MMMKTRWPKQAGVLLPGILCATLIWHAGVGVAKAACNAGDILYTTLTMVLSKDMVCVGGTVTATVTTDPIGATVTVTSVSSKISITPTVGLPTPAVFTITGDTESDAPKDVPLVATIISGVETDPEVVSCVATSSITVLKVDIDVDSDNNNRLAAPNRNDAEETQEITSPGKVVVVNVDDDDADGHVDNDDSGTPELDGDEDRKELVPVVVEFKPNTWDTGSHHLYFEATDYSKVRVFKNAGTYLVGPESGHNQPCELQPSDLNAQGILDLRVEGVALGGVTLKLVFKDSAGGEICKDEVLLTVIDTLEDAKPLAFAHRQQHKDTAMLCELGCLYQAANGHDWDSDHGQYLASCDHCAQYCTRATVQMINRYFGGGLSQDRISYHCKDEYTTSNGQLGHKSGIWAHSDPPTQDASPLAWALGLSEAGSTDIARQMNSQARSGHADDWQFIAHAIISYRPVAVVYDSPLHTVVVCGVRVNNGTKQVRVCNPMTASPTWNDFSSLTILQLTTVKDASVPIINARSDESSIATDTDGDGIMDFDEEEQWRFKTNPNGYGGKQEFRDPNNPPQYQGRGYDLDKTTQDSGGDPNKNDYQEVAEFYDKIP